MSTPQAVYTHDGGVDVVGVGRRADVTASPALCRSVVVCAGGVNPVAEKDYPAYTQYLSMFQDMLSSLHY